MKVEARTINQRMCVSCRVKKDKVLLVRVSKGKSGAVTLDGKGGSSGGRGAYVCRDIQCYQKAVKQKRLERALRCAIPAAAVEELGRHCGTPPTAPP